MKFSVHSIIQKWINHAKNIFRLQEQVSLKMFQIFTLYTKQKLCFPCFFRSPATKNSDNQFPRNWSGSCWFKGPTVWPLRNPLRVGQIWSKKGLSWWGIWPRKNQKLQIPGMLGKVKGGGGNLQSVLRGRVKKNNERERENEKKAWHKSHQPACSLSRFWM